MQLTQRVMDKLAIGLSIMCAVHCLATPLLLTLLPSLTAVQLDNEQLHLWILVAVIPTSLVALTLGCKKHTRLRYVVSGFVGVILMVLAVTLGEAKWGSWERKGLR